MAQNRVYDLNVALTATAQPDAGTPSAANDLVTLGFLSSLIKVLASSTRASPTSIVAGTGVAFSASSGYQIYIQFIQGSGGAVDVTSNPQIAAGSQVGQILILVGCHDTNTVYFEDGTGLEMKAGGFRMKNGSIIAFIWDGTNWCEMFRNNVGDLG